MTMLKDAPNVVQLVDYFLTVDGRQRIIQNIVMEYCESSLEDELRDAEKSKQPIPMEKVKNYTKQVFNGLANMHSKHISHRDLKPENILVKVK